MRAAAGRAAGALLFDVGGVLVDVDFRHAFRHWANAAGVPVEQIEGRFSQDAAYEAHERGEISGTEYFAALRNSLGIALSDAALHEGWCAIFRGVIPGVLPLLHEAAARTPVYLFSNTNALHYARWASLYPELLAPVRQVFCSQELGLRKPSAAAYDKVCSLIGIAPERIAFFDDLPDNVTGARAFGMAGYHVTTPDQTRRAVAAALGAA
jgi:putative hydrolase of the HAD superfamily